MAVVDIKGARGRRMDSTMDDRSWIQGAGEKVVSDKEPVFQWLAACKVRLPWKYEGVVVEAWP